MKSLPRSTFINQRLDTVRLYLDDLERIVGLLRDAGFDITIADDLFQYESFDELQKTQGRTPRQLKIKATTASTYHTISLSKSGRFWELYSSGEEHYGLAREIEALMRERQSTVDHLPLHLMFQAGNILLWIGFVFRARFVPVFLTLMAIGAMTLVCTLGLLIYWLLYPRIVLKYKHEAGFFARNRDAILLLLCGAVIGVIVHYLLSFFVGTSTPKGPP